MEALTEMTQEVHQPEGCQEVSNLFITGILLAANVRLQATHENLVPYQEAVKRLLKVQ